MNQFVFIVLIQVIFCWNGSYSFRADDCHRLFPSAGGTWLDLPPYWIPNCRQNETRVFDHRATAKCLKGRTVYAMGNSVGRQSLFGILEMLGGATVKRENQRDLCEKHETYWGDSCHNEYAGVKLKYLFLQYIDGFNYSDRGGFPYLTEIDKYDRFHLPDTVNDATGVETVWPIDGCVQINMRHCLERFFQNATSNDIVIMTFGLPYAVQSDMIDFTSWLSASAASFRANLMAVFPGKIFRFTSAQMYKHLTPLTDIVHRFDHEVLWPLWAPGSEPEEKQWYTIDQWAINKDRHRFYNDHIHFNGPLTHAMLHQVLNLLCPDIGARIETFFHLQDKIIVINRSKTKTKKDHHDRHHHYYLRHTRRLLDENNTSNAIEQEDSSEYYIFDKKGKLHSITSTCLPYIKIKSKVELSEVDLQEFEKFDPFPDVLCRADVLIRPANTREIFLMGNDYLLHPFANFNAFVSRGYDVDQVKVVDEFISYIVEQGSPLI
mmetsp:Transcript_11682/g.12599  ORF Transcript_11682/g.12599 Transcript_11682/m.12599 type:complete len:491 (+) Transcript_11682:114-1586(+)